MIISAQTLQWARVSPKYLSFCAGALAPTQTRKRQSLFVARRRKENEMPKLQTGPNGPASATKVAPSEERRNDAHMFS